QPAGTDTDTAEPTAYTLTLSQTVLPERADEIASVVARSPIDRFEHAFHFDNGDEYLAWTIATDAQRKATHLGYDAASAGIEAFVIAPDEQYGRLDDFFTSQPSMTPSRLVVYKQNLMAGETPIKQHLGPEHQDRFVGAISHELAAQSAGRALLSDLVKAYAKDKVIATLDETRHPYSHSLGFQKRGGTQPVVARIEDLVAADAVKIKTPEQLPPEYSQPEMHSDLLELHQNIGERIRDGYSYLTKQDYDMAGTTFNDVGDLQEVSGLIQKGDYDRACMHLAKLDTAVRDEIPSRLYELIYRF
nr:hypothetical protein [Phycisphaeraceae bacterium]